MIRRSTWIVLAIFAILFASFWAFNRYVKPNQKEDVLSTTPPRIVQAFIDVGDAMITGVTLTDREGNSVNLIRQSAEADWVVSGVPSGTTDTIQAGNLMGQLFALQVQSILSNTLTAESVGLDSPAYTIDMVAEGGETFKAAIGHATAISTGYYARFGSGPIITITKQGIDPILNMISTPPLTPTATPSPEPSEAVPGEATATPGP